MFEGCTELKSVTLPNTITTIDGKAFAGCSNLKEISELPDGMTDIGRYAFQGCRSLTTMVIPVMVTRVGFGAFEDCNGLTSLTIGRNAVDIMERCFYDCNSLKEVISKVEEPYNPPLLFSNLAKLQATLYVPKGCLAYYQSKSEWNFANIKEMDIPSGIHSATLMTNDKNTWYSISGQQLMSLPRHGVYIHNGKKIRK